MSNTKRIPVTPEVYAWSQDKDCTFYIGGKAANLKTGEDKVAFIEAAAKEAWEGWEIEIDEDANPYENATPTPVGAVPMSLAINPPDVVKAGIDGVIRGLKLAKEHPKKVDAFIMSFELTKELMK